MKLFPKEILLVLFLFFILSLIFYFPIFYSKIPFNGNLLVSFYQPLKYLSWQNYPTGVPSKFLGVDEIREFYPLLDFTYNSLRSFQLPLWNPYNFSGYPHIANLASGVFYPVYISAFFLSKIQILILFKISAIILSGFFTYLYLRSILLSKLSSLFGAASFAFSATMLIWSFEIWESSHSFLWLPLALFSIEKIIRTKKNKFIVLLAVSIALSIMAGYIQPTIYLILFSTTYSLARVFLFEEKEIWSKLIKITLGFILGLGLSSIQLLPTIEAFLLSPRNQVNLKELNISFLLSPIQLITFLIPDFFGHVAKQNWFLKRPGQYYENMVYIGLIPLVLAPFSLFLKKYKKYFIFFLLWMVFSLSLAFNLPISRLIYDLSIPFLSTAIPIRVIFVPSFVLSVLCALGVEWWLENKNIKKTLLAVLPFCFFFFIVFLFLMFSFSQHLKIKGFPHNWYAISIRNSILPLFFFTLALTTLFLGQFFNKFKKVILAILILILLVQSFLFTQEYFVFSEQKFLYPSHPLFEFLKKNQGNNRYWGYGSASITSNFSTVYKIYASGGYDPVNILSYNELMSGSRLGKFDGIFSRSDARLYPSINFPFASKTDERYKLMDFLGIKYVGFQKDELKKIDKNRFDPKRFVKAWEDNNYIIFENKKIMPRTFTVDEELAINYDKDAVNTFYSSNFNIKKQVILNKAMLVTKGGNSDINIIDHSPNRVIIKAKVDSPKILVLSDAYYPGWKAKINGKEVEVLRADYAFRALLLPKGENTVVFYFEPLSFYVGAFTSLFSIVISGILIFLSNKKLTTPKFSKRKKDN